MDDPHGGRPGRAARPPEAPRRPRRPGDEARLDVRLRGHADPRLPRQRDPEPGPAPLRDLRPDDHDRAEPARPEHDGGGGSRHHVAGGRGLLRGHGPQPRHPRRDAARARGAGPGERAQVGDPRLRGFHLRHPAPRVQAAHRHLAARERRHLLRERPRPRGPARRAHRRVQHHPARGGPRLRLQPGGGDAGGLGVAGGRQRRLHRPQLERPRGRPQAHLRRDPRLLPDRLQPDQRRARRRLPEDRGEGAGPPGARGPGPQGVLRSFRSRDAARRRGRGRTPCSRPPSTRRTRSGTSPSA